MWILVTEIDLQSTPFTFSLKFIFQLDVELSGLSPQDAEGRTPVHVAISNQHSVIIQLLISHPDIHLNVRDRQGLTPFACAMTYKNNKAAEAILKRESGAAEQVRADAWHPSQQTPSRGAGTGVTGCTSSCPKGSVSKLRSPFLTFGLSGLLTALPVGQSLEDEALRRAGRLPVLAVGALGLDRLSLFFALAWFVSCCRHECLEDCS